MVDVSNSKSITLLRGAEQKEESTKDTDEHEKQLDNNLPEHCCADDLLAHHLSFNQLSQNRRIGKIQREVF